MATQGEASPGSKTAGGCATARERMSASGRTIGVDLGTVRCGVAIDDELGRMAHPRPNFPAGNRRALITALVDLAHAEGALRFVVGLPVGMSGREGPAAARVRTFAQELADASELEVELWDERWTTVQAARSLREGGIDARAARAVIDAAAAMTILQGWLDARAAKKGRRRGGRSRDNGGEGKSGR
jgi:putative Holliday junction resolvase